LYFAADVATATAGAGNLAATGGRQPTPAIAHIAREGNATIPITTTEANAVNHIQLRRQVRRLLSFRCSRAKAPAVFGVQSFAGSSIQKRSATQFIIHVMVLHIASHTRFGTLPERG
jgi:hypothetical protein